MKSISSLISQMQKKFDAQIVSPWNQVYALIEIGPSRIGIAAKASDLPDSSELHLYPKNLEKVLDRDVFDVPTLIDAKLLIQKRMQKTPDGAFRPRGGLPKVIYPTGITSVDAALVIGGFLGRMAHRLWGASNGGKSLILQMLVITAWEMYRKPSLIIAPEYSFDEDRFRTLPGGQAVLDEEALEIYEPGSGHDAYDKAGDMISTGKYGIVGFDSITPLHDPEEVGKNMKDVMKPGVKAMMQTRFIEEILPYLHHSTKSALVLIVQSRRRGASTTQSQSHSQYDLVSGAYSPEGAKPASGDAVQFYVQQSLMLNAPSKHVRDKETGDFVGHRASGRVDKNHHAAMGRKFEFSVDYWTGIDVLSDLIMMAHEREIIQLDKRRHILPKGILPKEREFKTAKDFRAAMETERDLKTAVQRAVLKSFNPQFGEE